MTPFRVASEHSGYLDEKARQMSKKMMRNGFCGVWQFDDID